MKVSRVGIRKVQLVQEPIDCIQEDKYCRGHLNGTSFYFKINNREIYIKGANMVPFDYYPSRMSDEAELDWLLMSTAAANMNLLRVWGGGMYLDDSFYEKADRLGIMLWHDMMFSCKVYPFVQKDFVENSKIEVR